MLMDGVKFDDTIRDSPRKRAVASVVAFIERKLGVTAMYNRRSVPFGRLDLLEPLRIAAQLKEMGVINWYGPTDVRALCDEPPIRLWSCRIAEVEDSTSGGASVSDDAGALYAALAEAQERYIWWRKTDYFIAPVRATARDMQTKHRIIPPESFTGFSNEQRENSPALRIEPTTTFLWIEGTSLTTDKKVHVPAQMVSAAHRPRTASPREPLIRTQITNGLATWPTRAGAQLAGILECLEREAYMIMWFNQLTLPRANIARLRERSSTFDTLIARCERYRLQVHIVPLLTDAPTHAVIAVVEDQSGSSPRFSVGLKAHRSLAHASERAALEALRARRFTRGVDASKFYDPSKSVEEIGHRGRVHYWEKPEHAKHLEFLIAGEEREFPETVWEHDSIEQQLERVVRWCKEKNYECVSVPMTHSRANVTPWFIEMIVMPDIEPTHLTEDLKHLGGKRIKDVPLQFGYTPRETPFTERPHPFC